MPMPKKQVQYFKCLNCGETQVLKRNRLGKYCNIHCQNQHNWETKVLPNIENGKCKDSKTQRKYLSLKRGYKCEFCDMFKWLGKNLVLQVDHIDGNPDNNFPDNLRLLCPNCHSQTPTYKGGNKKKPKMDSRSKQNRARYAKSNGAPTRIRT